MLFVHGETSTAFSAARACLYGRIPVGHVEAGLRTYNLYSPYPAEFNRQAVGILTRYHFAPTYMAKANLLREGKDADTIYVTGNTVIDALKTTVRENDIHRWREGDKGRRVILLTERQMGIRGRS